MRTIAKRDLKIRMLEVFRTIEATGEEVVVTDRNRPVLRISPIRPKTPPSEVFASVRGKIRYHGDVVESTADEWPDT